MSVAVAGLRALGPAPATYDARSVIAAHVFRSARRGALVWGVVFGIFVLATVRTFVIAYPTVADRLAITRTLGSFAVLLGQPRHAETVAGFTEWRVLVVITVIGGIWGLLTSTSLLRGEEDAGRWEILLSGQTTKRRAAAQALVGLGRSVAVMFAATALLTVGAGRMPAAHFSLVGSLLFSIALVSGAAMFVAIGALTSQLSATRGQARMLGGAVLGVAFLIRMIADSSTGLGWLRWFSPIGWLEELHALRDTQPIALVPIAALIASCSFLAVSLAGRRDLNASILRDEGAAGSSRWLIGPFTLALHLVRITALGWIVGIGLLAFSQGFVSRAAATLLESSPAFVATLGRLGVRKASEGYLGVSFLTIEVLLTVVAASQIGAIRDEEATGRLDNLLVRPVRRLTWLAGRAAVSLLVLLAVGLAAASLTWFGAATQHTGVALPKMLEAGVNATTPAVFVLGAGVLLLGVRPRYAVAVAYAIVAWSFLIDLLGALFKGNDWIRDSSLFTHVALAPAAKPDWESAAVIVGLGITAAVLGAIAFVRRDIEYA